MRMHVNIVCYFMVARWYIIDILLIYNICLVKYKINVSLNNYRPVAG